MSTKRQAGSATRSHPWRDNIEAIIVSIIIIVLFKYFILEAYKIPTGSMQPTLMGWDDGDGGGIFDRVLVDKLSYHYRDPERWEIVVFKYPLDRSKNFIKRIVGMPDEELLIRHGDIFHRSDPASDLEILRRSRRLQGSMLKLLDSDGDWSVAGSHWSSNDGDLGGDGPGSATFPRSQRGVLDRYKDGYPGKLGSKLGAKGNTGNNPVGDLRLTGSLSADDACSEVRIELREGTRVYSMHLPGPAAADDARPSIRVTDSSGTIESDEVLAAEPWRLRAGRRIRFLAQNIDDLLELELPFGPTLELEIPAAHRLTASVTVVSVGGGAQFRELEVRRDIYYTSAGQKVSRWRIPEGQYVMLGDNTQDSSDGRDWRLAGYEVRREDGSTEQIWGNDRPGQNPITVHASAGSSLKYFYDEFGERRIFPADTRPEQPRTTSFVPRELIRGRAVLVVWPMAPTLGVYRLKWVR